MGPVRHVAQDGNLSAAVDPPCVIGCTALNRNLRAEHAHAAETLSSRTFNGYLYRLAPRPDASADAVLAFGQDPDLPDTVFDGLLDLFLEDPRRDTMAVNVAINISLIFFSLRFAHSFLLILVSMHSLSAASWPSPYRLC